MNRQPSKHSSIALYSAKLNAPQPQRWWKVNCGRLAFRQSARMFEAVGVTDGFWRNLEVERSIVVVFNVFMSMSVTLGQKPREEHSYMAKVKIMRGRARNFKAGDSVPGAKSRDEDIGYQNEYQQPLSRRVRLPVNTLWFHPRLRQVLIKCLCVDSVQNNVVPVRVWSTDIIASCFIAVLTTFCNWAVVFFRKERQD